MTHDATPPQAPHPGEPRRILLVCHSGRAESRDAAHAVRTRLAGNGIVPVMVREELEELDREVGKGPDSCLLVEEAGLGGVEMAIVLGGDGTILRTAELVRSHNVPLLGVNMGHVGFLAEMDSDSLDETVGKVIAGAYQVEERTTLEACVYQDSRLIGRGWALNEASVEKGPHVRMLEVAMEVDGRPLSTFGCDGVVLATPTGSTAYAFSAGGPVVWPEVDALLMVPLSAHALFARPLLVGPSSLLAVELLRRNQDGAVLWCDGRRTLDVPPGSRVEVRTSGQPVLLARLNPTPFSERLVEKFNLPVHGWRGPDDHAEPPGSAPDATEPTDTESLSHES